MDDDQLGEFAYDYVEVRRDYLAWTPAKEHFEGGSRMNAGDIHGIPAHSELACHGQMIEGQPERVSPAPSLPSDGAKSKEQ